MIKTANRKKASISGFENVIITCSHQRSVPLDRIDILELKWNKYGVNHNSHRKMELGSWSSSLGRRLCGHRLDEYGVVVRSR